MQRGTAEASSSAVPSLGGSGGNSTGGSAPNNRPPGHELGSKFTSSSGLAGFSTISNPAISVGHPNPFISNLSSSSAFQTVKRRHSEEAPQPDSPGHARRFQSKEVPFAGTQTMASTASASGTSPQRTRRNSVTEGPKRSAAQLLSGDETQGALFRRPLSPGVPGSPHNQLKDSGNPPKPKSSFE